MNLYLAENVREAVRIPVMAAGQIDRPEIQLHALETGKADILCFGRTLIADPDYPDKLNEGRLDEIIHCIACNKGCHDRSAEDRQVRCALNVRTGRETLDAFAVRPAAASRSGVLSAWLTRASTSGFPLRKSSYDRAPFFWLQSTQASTRLETRLEPPLARGTTRSMLRGTPSAPQ